MVALSETKETQRGLHNTETAALPVGFAVMYWVQATFSEKHQEFSVLRLLKVRVEDIFTKRWYSTYATSCKLIKNIGQPNTSVFSSKKALPTTSETVRY